MSQNAKGVPSATWSKMTKKQYFFWPPEAAENFRISRQFPPLTFRKRCFATTVFSVRMEAGQGDGYESTRGCLMDRVDKLNCPTRLESHKGTMTGCRGWSKHYSKAAHTTVLRGIFELLIDIRLLGSFASQVHVSEIP